MPDPVKPALSSMRTYPDDARGRGPYEHSMPVQGERFVKGLGQAGFKLGTCVGVEVRITPDGQNMRNWRACVSDGMETATQISAGDAWTWNEWHSVRDDEVARKALDALDLAKAGVAKDAAAAKKTAQA